MSSNASKSRGADQLRSSRDSRISTVIACRQVLSSEAKVGNKHYTPSSSTPKQEVLGLDVAVEHSLRM